MAKLADARQQKIAALGLEAAGQLHRRNGHLAQAISMVAVAALEVYVVVEVCLGAALDGAGGVAQHVGIVDDAVDEAVLLEALERAVERDAVHVGPDFLFYLGAGERVAFARHGSQYGPAHGRLA